MDDEREKAQRDYEWAISGARKEGREEGELVGLEKGREEGELVGLEKGELIGKVQLLEELLGDLMTPQADLVALDLAGLSAKLNELQQRLRDRQA